MLQFRIRFVAPWVCGLCIFYGCRPDYLKPADYVRYVRDSDNGFIQRQDQADVFIEAFYQPPEYAALMQISPGELSEPRLKKEMEGNSTFYQFMLSLGSATAAPVDEVLTKSNNGAEGFDAKKQKMLYRLQHSFALLAGKDSLRCVFYHAQPSGKIDNAYHFILAFEADSAKIVENKSENLTLVYLDSLWFQKRFDFVFDKNKINQSPGLKL